MKTARETAAISLTKPLTPCHAQQVVGGGEGAGPIRTWLGDAGEPRVLQKPSLFRAHSGDHGTCLREVSPGTKEMLGGMSLGHHLPALCPWLMPGMRQNPQGFLRGGG